MLACAFTYRSLSLPIQNYLSIKSIITTQNLTLQSILYKQILPKNDQAVAQ